MIFGSVLFFIKSGKAAGALWRRGVLRMPAWEIGVLFPPHPKFAPLEMRRQRNDRGNVLTTIPFMDVQRLVRMLLAARIVALDQLQAHKVLRLIESTMI